MTRVAVIGVGHVGKQHARIYAELPGADLCGVVDIKKPRADEVAALYKTNAFTDYTALFGRVDAVSLAIPMVDHARIGIDLLEHGIDVLVEKPIASTAEQGRALIDRATSTHRVLQVGHVERFNPVVLAAREVATKPQFFEIHRLAAGAAVGAVEQHITEEIHAIVDRPIDEGGNLDAVGRGDEHLPLVPI